MSDDPDHLLQILRETCLFEVRSDQPDLTLRQIGIALIVYQTDELQTIRGLAKHLNISKSVVTRALDRLEELELACRTTDARDLRSVLVQRTAGGAAMVERLGATMSAAAGKPEQVPANGPVRA
ncbi:MarR family transcriptional regulator [Belnapia sp. T18]|uniref:MarR family transcriptional regulator n=1 Tax=Belnapia arida TaxID=2804533 RepID=A0ABS1UCD5_9PROT|nr:MarR family transcriptional regulator [Belnapia arida]MBL6082353.1 MarR family transcriptional regulator [Belnapia arida]